MKRTLQLMQRLLTKRGLTRTKHRSKTWTLLLQNRLCLFAVQLEQGGHALNPQSARREGATVHIHLQSNRRHCPGLWVVTPDRILLPETGIRL
jgi:hypothetical protein